MRFFCGGRIRTTFRVEAWSIPPPLLVTSVALQGEVDVASKPCGSLRSSQEQALGSCALGKFSCCEPLPGCLPWSLTVWREKK